MIATNGGFFLVALSIFKGPGHKNPLTCLIFQDTSPPGNIDIGEFIITIHIPQKSKQGHRPAGS